MTVDAEGTHGGLRRTESTGQKVVSWFAVVEPVFGLGWAFFAAFCVVMLLLAPTGCPLRQSISSGADTLGRNWPFGLALLLPLFYRPLRTLIDELDEFFGYRRRAPVAVEESNPGTIPAHGGSGDADRNA